MFPDAPTRSIFTMSVEVRRSCRVERNPLSGWRLKLCAVLLMRRLETCWCFYPVPARSRASSRSYQLWRTRGY